MYTPWGAAPWGQQDPWSVPPYTIWRPAEFYLGPHTCWNAGGLTFDPQNRRLFMAERGLDGGHERHRDPRLVALNTAVGAAD